MEADTTRTERAQLGYESHPPDRPAGLSRRDLQFERQPATRWFNPNVLVDSALRHVLTSVFGSFLDKRELQANIPAAIDDRYAARPELWIDYLADTGDGFDSTYTMASLLARRDLRVEGCDEALLRGQMLVLGGDEVYPVATIENYEQRLAGPFRAALPWTVSDHPTLYALPGNHDWYDGLTGFLRLFGQNRWIGGWTTRQTRSYFAALLPHRWWLWGMDIQSNQFIDEPQLRFFSDVLEHSRPGDRLLLATAEPSWVETENRPEAYRNLAYVERNLLRRRGVELKLVVAGDLHHYSRYSHERLAGRIGPADRAKRDDPSEQAESSERAASAEPGRQDDPSERAASAEPGRQDDPTERGDPAGAAPGRAAGPVDRVGDGGTAGPVDRLGDGTAGPMDGRDPGPSPPRHLLTAGGGGAFLHPTHDLPRTLRVPVEPGLSDDTDGYRLAKTYPPRRRSRWMAWRAVLLPFRNPGFLWVGATVQVAFLWVDQFGLRSLSRAPSLSYAASAQRSGWRDLTLGLLRNPLAGVTLTLLAAALVGLTRRPPWTRRRSIEWLVRVVLGGLHTAAHVVALLLVSVVAIRAASALVSGGWFIVLTSVFAAGLGAVVSGAVIGTYFALANTFPGLRVHGNEAFSASRTDSHHCFLRLHLDQRGRLHVYALGVERTGRAWRPDTDTVDAERSWLAPVGEPPTVQLVDQLMVE